MKKYFHQLTAIAFIALVGAGCASAPAKFYTLNSTVAVSVTPAANYSIIVGPVSVPAEVDRPQFTVQVAPNRVAIDEFNRWAEPLNDNIARVVAGDLAALLGTPRVAAGSPASFNPDYRVTLAVQQFESVPGKFAQIKVVWVISKTTGRDTTTGMTQANEPVKNDSYDALAAAHSRALAKVSTDIAAAIRSEAEIKP